REVRWTAIAVASVLAWGYFTLLRFEGVTGNIPAERRRRWTPSAEDKFLLERQAQASLKASEVSSDSPTTPEQLVATDSDWTGFRGPRRDGHVANVSIKTDWSKELPKRLWQRRVGPAWSSFAVV